MYCENCGSPIADGLTNCPNCNEPINISETAPIENQQTAAEPAQQTTPFENAQSSADNYYTPPQSNYNPQPDYNTQQQGYSQPYGQQYNQSYNQQYNPNGYYQSNPQQMFMEQEINKNLSNAKTLGILAIVLGLVLSPIVGIICGAIGLSKVNDIVNFTNNPMIEQEMKKVKKLNKLGIIIPIVVYAVIILFAIITMVAGLGLASSALYFDDFASMIAALL